MPPKRPQKPRAPNAAASYQHPEAQSPMRPDVGTQAQFRKKKPPATYRYDSSLSPALEWVSQAFFPRTGAWDSLKKHLRGQFEDSVWEHLSGDTSAPFPAGEHAQVAVKVIDDRGNELLVVKALPGAKT